MTKVRYLKHTAQPKKVKRLSKRSFSCYNEDMDMIRAAQAIAGEGKYEDIVEKLRESGALSFCVAKMQHAYGGRLTLDHFSMTERDWEMFAVLWLYDTDTLEHSVRTFELAYRIITHPFIEPSSGETVVFEDCLLRTDVSTEQFLRAALFHDIGKVIIPREVLRNALDDEEVLVRILPEGTLTDKEEGKQAFLRMLYSNGVRPIDVVPLSELFDGKRYAEFLSDLKRRGFSEMATLKDVVRMHEPESRRILSSLGHATEALLAGTHHNYHREEHRYVVHILNITCAVSDLIRIADITDALRSARWYKRPLSELEVLFILTQDALAGRIHPRLAYLWVNDRYAALEKRGTHLFSAKDEDAKEEMRAIEMFLEKEKREMLAQ